MDDKHLTIPGVVIPMSALAISRARWFADVLGIGGLDYVKLIESVRNDADQESVILDVEVELPQKTANCINRVERIAVRFNSWDIGIPEVLALRRDFPHLPHTNLREAGTPRSLCLFDVAWDEIRLRWTPATFFKRIRTWLAESAKGTLHQNDQPLEPMLLENGLRIILPPNLFVDAKEGECKRLWVTKSAGDNTLTATLVKAENAPDYSALSFVTKPQMHGCIRHQPSTIADLNQLLKDTGIELIKELHQRFSSPEMASTRISRLMMVIAFPLNRNGVTSIEVTDLWVFATLKSIAEIGDDIGLWQSSPGDGPKGHVLFGATEHTGSKTEIVVLKPVFSLTRKAAAEANGFEPDERKVTVIGTGAIGSEIVTLLAKSGFGKWTLIDDDVFLPHNLTKHSLGARAIGAHKVAAMSAEINSYYEEKDKTKPIAANLLHPGNNTDNVKDALISADLILDLSASVPVSRHLARNIDGSARRLSLFLNPRGTDLVFLAEDKARTTPLDCLEMQYLREVSIQQNLKDHLRQPKGRLRYARSCRDVSSVIPNDQILTHSAIGAHAIRNAISKDDASILIWTLDEDTLEVRRLIIPVVKIWTSKIGEWTIVSDARLSERLATLRSSKLPKETGGVLLGTFDMDRRIVYVVDTIPSPPDSEEWPRAYIRGRSGLKEKVDRIQERTEGQLQYIGEWHSHPNGCSCDPSNDDRKMFLWLTENMAVEGLPPLMAIVGDRRRAKWFIGSIEDGVK